MDLAIQIVLVKVDGGLCIVICKLSANTTVSVRIELSVYTAAFHDIRIENPRIDQQRAWTSLLRRNLHYAV